MEKAEDDAAWDKDLDKVFGVSSFLSLTPNTARATFYLENDVYDEMPTLGSL